MKKPVGSEKAWYQIVRKLRRGRRGGETPVLVHVFQIPCAALVCNIDNIVKGAKKLVTLVDFLKNCTQA